MHKLTSIIVISCATSMGFLFAADVNSLPITDLQQRVIDNSLTLQTDQWNLSQRMDALEVNLIDHAKITTSATSQKSLDSDLPAQSAVTVKADVDINAKVNLSAQTDTNKQTSLGITYTPFASDFVSANDQEQYQLAALTLSYDHQELMQQLDRAVLNVNQQENTLSLAQENITLTQALEKAKRGSLALGVATVSDVAQASQDSVSAQQEMFTAQVNLLDAQQVLYQLIGSEVEAPKLSTELLSKLVQQRSLQLATLTIDDIESEQRKQLTIEHQTLTTELEEVNFYNSDIRITGEYDVNANAVKVGASFTFSKAQFGASTIMDLDQELQLKSTALMQQQTQLENSFRLLKQKLALTEKALASRLLEQAIYQQDLNEMILLQQQGERTSLQVAQQRYLKQKADSNVYSALVSLYLAQNDLAAMWP